MIDRNISIPAELRDAFPKVMASHGYRTVIVDPAPVRLNEVSTKQRFICGHRINAVVITICESELHPNMPFVTISSDFWLLIRHGKMTFDRIIVDEITAAVAASRWMIENAETPDEQEAVDRMLRGKDQARTDRSADRVVTEPSDAREAGLRADSSGQSRVPPA
jgi:hypothetical protein